MCMEYVQPQVEDLVAYEGAVWKIINYETPRISVWIEVSWEASLMFSLQWIAGPRSDKVMFIAGICHTEVRLLSDMEVLALSAQDHD